MLLSFSLSLSPPHPPSLLPHRAAVERASEGRPCCVERGSSLSFKSHSLWRLPLRISQRDQRRRGSDRGEGGEKKEERERERQRRDRACGGEREGNGRGTTRGREVKERAFFFSSKKREGRDGAKQAMVRSNHVIRSSKRRLLIRVWVSSSWVNCPSHAGSTHLRGMFRSPAPCDVTEGAGTPQGFAASSKRVRVTFPSLCRRV